MGVTPVQSQSQTIEARELQGVQHTGIILRFVAFSIIHSRLLFVHCFVSPFHAGRSSLSKRRPRTSRLASDGSPGQTRARSRVQSLSRRAVPQEARFGRPALEPHGTHHLRVAWHEVDRLITPLHLVAALDVKHDALDGALGRQADALAVCTGLDLEPELRDGGERNELERLRPGSRVSGSRRPWTRRRGDTPRGRHSPVGIAAEHGARVVE